MISRTIGNIIARILIFAFSVPKEMIKLYRQALEKIGTHFRVTALMIRVFVIELIAFEGVTEILPLILGDKLLESTFIRSFYTLITKYQWNIQIRDKVDFIITYLITDLDKLPAIFIVGFIVCLPGLIVAGILICAVLFNLKYLAVFMIADLTLMIPKLIRKIGTMHKKSETITKSIYGDAGYVRF